MNVELADIVVPAETEVKIEVSVTSHVNVTAQSAQRKVSKLLLDYVGNLLYGERPGLVVGERLLWRVPVWLALPETGPVGKAGAIEVDAQTGEILYTQQLLDDIAERANVLATRASSATG